MKNDQDFTPNRMNKYSIRKLSIGTASLLVGSILVFGFSNDVQASELKGGDVTKGIDEKISTDNEKENNEKNVATDNTLDNSSNKILNSKDDTSTNNTETDLNNQSHDNNNYAMTSDKVISSESESSFKENQLNDSTINKEIKNNQKQVDKKDEYQFDALNLRKNELNNNSKVQKSIIESTKVNDKNSKNNLRRKNEFIAKETVDNRSSEENLSQNLKVSERNVNNVSPENIKLSNKELINLNNKIAESRLYSPIGVRSNRDLTEDSSLEALDYSDNYTFQTLIFQPDALTTKKVLDGKSVPFQIHSYLTGANSGDRYKIDLQLDPVLANHVTKIKINPAGRTSPVELVRLANKQGKLTNIWQVNFIRANGGLFGGAEILSQYTAENGVIELDDTVRNILEGMKDHTDKLNYLIYVKDSLENKKIQTSETSGYFLTPSETLINNIVPSNSSVANSVFKGSSGSLQYDSTIGKFGGVTIDQQILKNGTFSYGGPIIDSELNKQWRYHYQIDPTLIPFIGSIELHRYDFRGVGGFDKVYYEKNKVADLAIDKNGRGSISDSDLNKLIEFNNSLPETVGIRIVIKYNQSPNNILTRDAKYDENGNLIRSTTRIKEDFAFNGYFTDRNGGIIKNTFGSSTYYIQDLDQDGLTDNFEIHKSQSDPFNNDSDGDGKNDGDEVLRYETSPLVGKPMANDITTEDTAVEGKVQLDLFAPNQKVKILDENGTLISTGSLNDNGGFRVEIPKLKAGTYTIAIESPNYSNDEVNTFKVINIKEVLKPTIEPLNDQSTSIEVNGVEGSTIIIKDENDNVIGKTVLNKGETKKSIELKKTLKEGTILTAIAEKNGFISNKSNPIIVKDITAPEAPTMNDFTSNDKEITGEAEPGSTVEIVFQNGQKMSAQADDQGHFTVEVPAGVFNNGGQVIAKATDTAGNESSVTTKDVADETAPTAPIMDEFTSNDNQITGQAEPGSTVEITFPDGQKVSGKADDQGYYTVKVPEKALNSGGEVTAKATDTAGNESSVTTKDVADETAPTAPIMDEFTSNDNQITGQAEPNSTVEVTFPDGQKVSVQADDQGRYTIDVRTNALNNGGQVSVKATDTAGNESEVTTKDVADETAPTAPIMDEFTSNDNQITGQAEPGSTVEITFPDGQKVSGKADDQGHYTVKVPEKALNNGGQVSAKAIDTAGNESEVTTKDVADETAPTASTMDEFTSNDKQITGQAEPNSTVEVTFPTGEKVSVQADNQGRYTIDVPTNALNNGGQVSAKVTDAAGNESEVATKDVADETAPTAPIMDEFTSNDNQITGQAEPGSTVEITFPDGQKVSGKADDQGYYTVKVPEKALNSGGEVTAKAIDAAGNESSVTTKDVGDETAPTAPIMDEFTSNDSQITGQAEPNSTVEVTFPTGQKVSVQADDQGRYTIDVPTNALNNGGQVSVKATDTAGNESSVTTKDVGDETAPTAPTMDEFTSNDNQITGQAEPNSTVEVTFPEGQKVSVQADDQGHYTVKVPEKALNNGGQVSAKATDTAGNQSEVTTKDVADETAPTAPTMDEFASNDKQITGQAEPESTVEVTFPTGEKVSVQADNQGRYTIDVPTNALNNGGQVSVKATDTAGNESSVTTKDVGDETAPTAPTMDEFTSNDNQITGQAEPGSTVEITFPDGQKVSGKANDQGYYTVKVPEKALNSGGEVTAKATDTAGNESSVTTKDVGDETAPTAPTMDEFTSNDNEITGQAEAKSTVEITFPTREKVSVQADDQGHYTVKVPEKALNNGGQVTVKATDVAGNESAVTMKNVADKTAPNAPQVNSFTSVDKQITGQAEPNIIVIITLPNGNNVIGKTDNQGIFTINLPKGVILTGNERVIVSVKDRAGNISPKTEIIVIDKTAPNIPIINKVKNNDKQITGQGEPNAKVIVTLPNNQVLLGKVDSQGHFEISVPEKIELKPGDEVQVFLEDVSGNKSQISIVIIENGEAKNPDKIKNTHEDSDIINGAKSNNPNNISNHKHSHITQNQRPLDNDNENSVIENNSDEINTNHGKFGHNYNDVKQLPKTGTNDNYKNGLWGSIFAMLGSFILFGKRRKDKKEN